MGSRGPKAGAKAARLAANSVAPVIAAPVIAAPAGGAIAAAQAPVVAAAAEPVSAADRENPEKLNGEALRVFAHRRGLARSAVDAMDDAKIRRELRILAYRQYETA